MTIIPQSPFLSADVHPLSAEPAAALDASPPVAAAGLIPDPSNEGRHQGAPASASTVTVAAGDVGATDCIGEIFVGARKLDRFVLDVGRFMLDIEEPPLFLQRATG